MLFSLVDVLPRLVVLHQLARPVLRLATIEDAPRLSALGAACLPDETGAVEWWVRRLKDEAIVFWLLERASMVCGCVGCTTREPSHDLPLRGHVTLLAVHTAWRRRGYGALLMRTAIGALAPRHMCVSLLVRSENTVAVRLYSGLGFRVHRRLPGYYRDGGEGLLCVRWDNGALEGR
jgi:ribosomal protein S18 acetylase RimI-like enzyme